MSPDAPWTALPPVPMLLAPRKADGPTAVPVPVLAYWEEATRFGVLRHVTDLDGSNGRDVMAYRLSLLPTPTPEA